MNNYQQAFLVILILTFSSCQIEAEKTNSTSEEKPERLEWAIAIHGGAGNFDSTSYSKEQIDAYTRQLQKSLDIGKMILNQGGEAVDVVEHVIKELENSPLFNAGRGAVFTSEGRNELDASIMNGRSLNCGSVAGISNIKNPITAARLVMEKSKHVFLSGSGATSYALENGLEWADSSYFKTKRRWDRYLKLSGKEIAENDFSSRIDKFGTVGCVVLDMNGDLAAGTSTGGMMMKKNGRIGDSPIIAAGTYADNRSCAVSCTGHGEYFIRAAVAHDLSARMRYGNQSLEEASEDIVMKELLDLGGDGGLIAVDRLGNIHLPFNTSGMFRGFANSKGEEGVAMFE